jgi:hypothetical protein
MITVGTTCFNILKLWILLTECICVILTALVANRFLAKQL